MVDMDRGYEVIKRIKRIKQMMHENMESMFKSVNLTAPQGMVVGTLFKNGPMKIGDISQAMDLSMSTISGIIDRLEKSDIVIREKSTEDKRVILVDLTPTFKKSSKELFNKLEFDWGEKIKNATEEEIEAILNGFDALENVLIRSKKAQ
jgi:DNA-binding MarR family transcriptional regulator